jgi:hypothetical protein
MKRARIGFLAAAVLAVTSVAFAQAKPDFSGTWTLDAEATAAASPAPAGGGGGGRGGGMGGPMVVKQTADTLTIERTRGENKVTTTYKLDGTESTNTMAGREGATTEVKSMAKWDGPKLTITTKRGEMETTESWTMEGSTLTIERTGGRGGSKQVYKKTT